MAKLTLLTLDSLQSETTAVQLINENNSRIETALENTFSRDGTTPNQLEASLDANSQRIINLPAPSAGSDAARLVDVLEAALPDIAVPSLTGNSGKLLSNDETSLTWLDIADIPDIGDMKGSNNLSELTNAAMSRSNLGLGSSATYAIGTSGNTVPILSGNNTWSGTNTYSTSVTYSSSVTFTGTSDVRLQTTPTVINTDSVGFRGAPQNTQDATYTFVMGDVGKSVVHTAAGAHTWTIPDNATTAIPIGAVIPLVNIGSGAVTVSRGPGVSLRQAGSSTDADQTLNQHGFGTLYKASANSWYML